MNHSTDDNRNMSTRTSNCENCESNLIGLEVHDLVALGEYASALRLSSAAQDEILRRLPYFLHLLTSSQSLSSIPTIQSLASTILSDDHQPQQNQQQQQQKQQQQYVDEIVSLLEITAATYPQSETMELLISFLIPKVVVLNATANANANANGSMTISRKKNQLIKLKMFQSSSSSSKNGNTVNSHKSPTKITSNTNTAEEEENHKKKHSHTQKIKSKPNYAISKNGTESYSKCNQHYISSIWDTTLLQSIIDQYTNMYTYTYKKDNRKKKKKSKSNHNDQQFNDDENDEDDDNESESEKDNDDDDDDENDDTNDNDDENDKPPKKKMKIDTDIMTSSSNNTRFKEEDSQEFNIKKILMDVIGLVISSLEPIQLKITDRSSTTTAEATSCSSSKDNGHNSRISGTTQHASAATNRRHSSTSTLPSRSTSSTVKEDEEQRGGEGSEQMKMNTSSNHNSTYGIPLQIHPDSMLTETFTRTRTPAAESTNTNDANDANISSQEQQYCSYAHSNLSAILTSLLHHVPILRHEHVANALCRASSTKSSSLSIPQCAHLIQRLAANSPSTSCTLLRGCINAYQSACVLFTSLQNNNQSILDPSSSSTTTTTTSSSSSNPTPIITSTAAPPTTTTTTTANNHPNNNNDTTSSSSAAAATTISTAQTIITTAKESVAAIAKLSKREASHVITILKQSHAMPDLLISLMMEHNPTVALATLLEDLIIHNKQLVDDKQSTTNVSSTNTSSFGRKRNDSYKNRSSRWKNIRRQKRQQCSISHVIKNMESQKAWIIESIKKDTMLSSKVRQFISLQLEAIINKSTGGNNENASTIKWGETTLILQVYIGLIHCIGIGSDLCPGSGSGSTFVITIMNHITNICKRCKEEERITNRASNLSPPPFSKVDEFIKMAISACIVTCTKFSPSSDARDERTKRPSMIACVECLKCQLEWHVSERSQGFLLRIMYFIRHKYGTGLKYLLLDVSLGGTEFGLRNSVGSNMVNTDHDYMNFCVWASSIIEELAGGTPQDNLLCVSPYNILQMIDGIQHNSTNGGKYDAMISSLLKDANKCQDLFHVEGFTRLIGFAASTIALRPPPIIPAILPLSIESQVSRFTKKINDGTLERKLCCQIIMQLVYTFTFLDKLPGSPYAINPRSLPLRTVLKLVYIERNEGSQAVELYVMKYSPETFNGWIDSISYITSVPGFPRYQKNKVTAKDVGVAIRKRLSSSKPYDALAIERLFIYARSTQPPSMVDIEASLALMDSIKDPIHLLTYAKLCQDPIMLIKCSLKVWVDEGLRRILLAIMQRLLEANENISRQISTTSDVASEYLVSRDSIILRSWLFILGSVKIGNNQLGHKEFGIKCPLLVSMVRSMIASRPGLVSAIVKQLAPVAVVDWLVAHVPEIRSEAKIFLNMLERGALSTVERLHVADAALRIAITHGSKHEAEFQPLAYIALSILVNSFYIVIGPVGVPINVTRDQEGRDTTLICRKYLFRMFSAVKMMKEDMIIIKNEARMAFSKLAGLCKSDMSLSGLTGAVAQRRKVVLKELWDALVRVNTSLGGGIQL